jgi:hypothetical protein
LRLDHRAFITKGGDSGPAIVPGEPNNSLLIKAIGYADPDRQMPPKEKLSAAAIDVLRRWVKLGAPWPDEKTPAITTTKDGFSEEDRQYWFFQPLASPSPPTVESVWVRNDIDRFIAAKHAELKLEPAPEADRHELIRRVYFDLHGLPPSPAEIDAFVRDPDPKAYE